MIELQFDLFDPPHERHQKALERKLVESIDSWKKSQRRIFATLSDVNKSLESVDTRLKLLESTLFHPKL